MPAALECTLQLCRIHSETNDFLGYAQRLTRAVEIGVENAEKALVFQPSLRIFPRMPLVENPLTNGKNFTFPP